jgi:hypothetical protein
VIHRRCSGGAVDSARPRGKEEPIVVDPDYGFGLRDAGIEAALRYEMPNAA